MTGTTSGSASAPHRCAAAHRAAGRSAVSVEEARSAVLAAIAGPTAAELAYLSEARGRILAEDVMSLTALPPWDNSAMDGYAIRAADVAAATRDGADPARRHRRGAGGLGARDGAVERGTAIRIATGAPMPPRADAVVQVELDDARRRGRSAGRRARTRRGRPAAGRGARPRARSGRDGDPAGRRRPARGDRDPDAPAPGSAPAAIAPGRRVGQRDRDGPSPAAGRHPGDRRRGPRRRVGRSGRPASRTRTDPGSSALVEEAGGRGA